MKEEKRAEKGLSVAELLGGTDVAGRIEELSFEHGLKLVEELVSQVESGTLPLDKAILSYEKGVALIAHLRGLLSGAEERLRVLQVANSGGKPESEG